MLYNVVSDVNGLNTKHLSKISSSLHLVERWERRRELRQKLWVCYRRSKWEVKCSETLAS